MRNDVAVDGSVATRSPTGTQSVRRALGLLSTVAEYERRGPLSLADLASETALSKPTVHRLLTELVHTGYLEQTEDRRYRLGPEAHTIGSAAERRHGVQQQAIASAMRLAEVSEDAAFISVRRGTHSVCLHREEGTWPIRSHVLQAGDRYPLGVGAHGMALLAAMSPQEASAVTAANSVELSTNYSNLTPDWILEQADLVRRRGGVAVNEGTVVPESWAIGIAVPDASGEPVMALSIAAISSRLGPDRQARLAVLLRDEAARLVPNLRRNN
ncbi:IclR family transcriptional regulator [Rhodococcus fascians]|nr:IclR family transcriptional regulator [Rhodococcus fascians]MBY3997803.1 IclR family transcriptional regulator [Rhodococcus fascians]MBY4002814.1 IclR family transcriptional regulator [Rhodococcus fascians]MBY4006805.1 IclR family transcriptional regulator [Rhodococcus fascians]MBY4019412.1 IclR family transcriptional regulator [Rhodococcus fascians]